MILLPVDKRPHDHYTHRQYQRLSDQPHETDISVSKALHQFPYKQRVDSASFFGDFLERYAGLHDQLTSILVDIQMFSTA